MIKSNKAILIVLTITFLLSNLMPIGFSDQEQIAPDEAEIQLESITSEEQAVLEQLFLLSQEIDILQLEQQNLKDQILLKTKEIEKLNAQIVVEKDAYDEHLAVLAKALKIYQKNGPNSYFEILFSSASLNVFVQKVNILRDFTKNTKTIVDQLETVRLSLELNQSKQKDALKDLEMTQIELAQNIKSKEEVRKTLETSLVNLKDKRAEYEAYLNEVQKVWSELKPLFKKTVDQFSSIIESGNLPYNAISLQFTLKGIKGSLSESVFNDILKNEKDLPKLKFQFHDAYLTLSIPEKHIVLDGNFELIEGKILKFVVTKGSFYELPLEPESVEELFSEGYMTLNLTTLLDGYKINTITLKEDYLELLVGLF